MAPLLNIQNLHASVEGKPVLNGVNLKINEGEIHALMGPNGSGKSTLSNILMGHPKFRVTKGKVMYKGKDLLKMKPHERALAGIFLAFQYPKEIGGVSLEEFLLAAYRAKQKHDKPNDPPVLVFRFKAMLDELMKKLKMPEKFAERYLNVGFSGGEKKKAEVLQMAVLRPDLAVMDETDSGLDVDALKTVCAGIKQAMKGKSVLLVTHYQRVLKYLTPDFVHVLKDGKIVKSGGKNFAEELEKKGYEAL
ncbi:Fe-S cluster assembly ATPase SufC [Candidatus Peregrinibacteria bacterium]|nr:Fe-S cluster assembly ATPase SufC [Candidatus Peregrinibacteria bacterium]